MNLPVIRSASQHAPARPPITYIFPCWPAILCLLIVLSRHAGNIAVAGENHNYTFFGTLTYVDPADANAGIAHVGDPYILVFGVDSSFLNDTGNSRPVTAVTLTVRGSGVGLTGVGGQAFVGNDLPQSGGGSLDCFFLGSTRAPTPLGNPALDGTDVGVTLISRSPGSTAGPFTSRAFPTSIDLSAFSERYMSAPYYLGIVQGTVEGFYIDQIPEPCSISLIAIAFILFRRKLSTTVKL